MAQEIEIKFPLRDRAALVQKLTELGAQRLYAETFEDNIVLDRRGELRTKGTLLRVRKFGRYALATFKGPVAFDGNAVTLTAEVDPDLVHCHGHPPVGPNRSVLTRAGG